MSRHLAKAYDCGCVAGQIAAVLWLAPQQGIQSSIRKAETAIVETYKGRPKALTRNQDFVHKAWRSHKCAAHLWAALAIQSSQQNFAEDCPESTFAFFLRPALPGFLALAKGIYQSLSQRDGWDVTSPWSPPARLELPTVLREEEEHIDFGDRGKLVFPKGGLIVGTLPICGDLQTAFDHYKANPYRK